MSLTLQNGLITSHLPSPNPEEEQNFEARVPTVEFEDESRHEERVRSRGDEARGDDARGNNARGDEARGDETRGDEAKSKQFVFPHHSSQMIPQLYRSIPYIPTQIDNLAENANSNTITQSKI